MKNKEIHNIFIKFILKIKFFDKLLKITVIFYQNRF